MSLLKSGNLDINQRKNLNLNFYFFRDPVRADDANSIVTIAGQKKRIEFDIWDHRGGSRNSNRAFGWTTCDKTIRTFCTKHDQESALEFAEYDPADIEDEKGSADGSKKPKDVKAVTAMKAMPGYDPQVGGHLNFRG